MTDDKMIGISFLITFIMILLIGIFAFPKEPFDNSTTWYTATITIDANPQQVFNVKNTYPIKAESRWGHNNLNCDNISSTAPIIVTNQQSYVTHSYPCNLFWTRFWFIIILIFVWIFGTGMGIAGAINNK